MAINSILWTSVATRHTLARMGAELGSVNAQKGTMKDAFAMCLKKTDVQVWTFSSVYVYCSVMQIIALATTYLL
jgi:hypothetical protein